MEREKRADAPTPANGRLLACFGTIALLLAIVLGAGYWASRPARNHQPELDTAFATAASRLGHGRELRLAESFDFPWDRVHVFKYGTTADVLRRGLGFAWSPRALDREQLFGEPDTAAAVPRQLVVFVRAPDEVAAWFLLNGEVEDRTAVSFEMPALPAAPPEAPAAAPGPTAAPALEPHISFERAPARFEVHDVLGDLGR